MTIKSTIYARVIFNKPLQKDKSCKYFRMALALDKPVKKVIPGQFVHINLNSKEHFAAQAGEVTARLSQWLNASEHILPRPFTIFDVKERGRVIEVVYQVVGKGTELMSHLKSGHKVRVLCPLGNGFRVTRKAKMSVLVGGGVGSAGLYLLLKEMKGQGIKDVRVFIGARTRDDLCLLPEFRKLCKDIMVATEDGSLGSKGFITSVLETFLHKSCILYPVSCITLYACGPSGMSEALRKIAVARRIPCQLSLEGRMGCGVGLCRVCVCKTKQGYATVCEDGPVFEAGRLAPL